MIRAELFGTPALRFYEGRGITMLLIKDVLVGSLADVNGIQRGDQLIRINGKDINDVLDYRFS